ncbi:hemerythrin domain-containing protein [Bdellovibrio sp. HCB185ZH]|uniref:hemerythrin domain-containing protein n=1 Tax=Bdellovibrio sp. HCB185ZH TaxID=3394235 RepID=UPI0039A5D42E
MEILAALVTEHKVIRGWLHNLCEIPHSNLNTRSAFIDYIIHLLAVHHQLEEVTFYTPLKVANPICAVTLTRHLDHGVFLIQLQNLKKISEATAWETSTRQLRATIENHFIEEESFIFLAGKTHFTEEEGKQLGQLFKKMQEKLHEQKSVKADFWPLLVEVPPRFYREVRTMFEALT